MTYVLLIYGLAFFLLGVTLYLQARLPAQALPARSLWLLAGFGVIHGTAEWLSLAVRLESGSAWEPRLRLAFVVAMALSFALLLQFALETLGRRGRWPRWVAVLPGSLLLALLVALAAIPEVRAPGADRTVEIVARYLLGLPGAVLSGWALAEPEQAGADPYARRRRRCLVLAGSVFIAYGFFAGLVVPPGAFPPASVLNNATFGAAVGVPVELFRAVCALAIGFLLAEAFVIEAGRATAREERLREEFISAVAHELRNVVNMVSLAAVLLEAKPGGQRDEERERSMVERIRKGTRTLTRMVDDLLDASRLETKRLALKPARLDLRTLVTQLVERAPAVTEGRPVKMELPPEEASVFADPMRVEQVLLNLLSNADKYSQPHSEIAVAVRPSGSEWVTSVANRGPGIRPEELPLLFSRFYRAKSAEKSGVRGLGLGLYIAKGLVEAQGGRIWVESIPGETTTFFFALPRGRG